MRFLSIIPALLLSIFAGCSCCPNYYGPGLTPQPYGSCVGTQTIAPPFPSRASGRSHRPTLAEHKQARDLRRWYKELNRETRNPRRRRATGYDDYYDETAFYDEGMMYNDGYYDGQIIDGGMAYGGDYSSSYCPSCQDQQPQYSQPMMYESEMQPTMSEPAPAPPMEPTPAPATTDEGTPSAFLNHLYSPQPSQPGQIQQVNIPPVEQVLYAPTGPASAR